MKNIKTSKINVEKTIFRKTSNSPFTWKELKNIKFEDEDIISVSYVEPYYSENNSWDEHFCAEVTRMVEETDEEFKTRQKIMEAEEQFDKDRRRMTYERLKAEFENEK